MPDRPPVAPFAYENWKRRDSGALRVSTFEIPLYTDAWITGDLSDERALGPYSIVNTILLPRRIGYAAPAYVLRYDDHFSGQLPGLDLEQTNDEGYHGGLIQDEVAALLALALGVRIWAGGMTRFFSPDGDPRGRPRAEDRARPVLAPRRNELLIPSSVGPCSFSDADPLRALPQVAPQDAMVLVRAARQYQHALWIADSDPNIAWLLLVSAAEAAATHWFTGSLSDEEVLHDHKPDLWHLLGQVGGGRAIDAVAAEFAGPMKATAKFVRFLLAHTPDPPQQRPHASAQHPWTHTELKRTFETIYSYRSRALHGGRPFPYPMCAPAFRHDQWKAPEEVPGALATGSHGGSWRREDTPMLLHTFSYIARHALLKWWNETVAHGPV